jgi:hypothetical protein
MDNYLYKYMNLRPTFFKEPMLRATPLHALNDPFEGLFNIKQIKNATMSFDQFYTSQGIKTNTVDDSELDGLMEVTQSDLYSLGIISLTEDNINPLMWSHYADEHKGVVIELLKDIPLYEDSLKIVNGKYTRFGKDSLGEVYEYPEKVFYKREKPTFEHNNELAPNSINEYHWKKFNKSILFTKSNDWLYEKEYRSVVRLSDADRIICDNCSEIRSICIQNPEISLIELPNNQIQVTYPREYEMHEEMGDESIKQEIFCLSNSMYNPSVMHFFRLNPKSINSIYFGYNSDITESLKNISKNQSLEHIKNIYKMDIDEYSYSLKITKC